MEDPFSPLLTDRPIDSEQETRAEWLTRRARMIFSSYRRDDYADPDSFLAQLTVVLGSYQDSVVTYASDPLTGIQRRSKFPPTIAEVSEFCDDRQAISERMRHYATLPQYVPDLRPRPKYHVANLRVPITAPCYPAMKTLAEKNPDLVRRDDDGVLMVPLSWMDTAAARTGWKSFSLGDIGGSYQPHDGGDGDATVPGAAAGAGSGP